MPSPTSRWRSRTTTRWSSRRRWRSPARWSRGAASSGAPATTTRRTRVRRRLPVLLPALSELRVRRVVQPLDRRVHARRGRLRSLRRRRRGPALQPADRHLLARRRGLRSVRRARRRAGLQPAHGRVRRDAAGLERVRQLGQTGVQRGDQWATTSRYTNNVTGKTTRTTQTSERGRGHQPHGAGSSSTVGRTGSGDVYAGHDGNVYRKEGDSWQKYDNGGWNNVEQPTQQQRQQAQANAQAARVRLGFSDRRAGEPRFRRARRGHPAHARREQRAQRHLVAGRQLPRERRPGRGGRR